MTLPCPIQVWARRAPHALALAAPGRRLSYAQLDTWTAEWAARLRALELHPGDRLALLSTNRAEVVPLFFAAGRVGITLVMLNARLAPPELASLVRRSGAQRVLAEGALLPRVSGASSLEEIARAPARSGPGVDPGSSPLAVLDPTQDWAVLFTSGTTGTPKGARLTVDNLVAAAAASRARLGTGPSDRWLCTLPLFHVGGLAMLVRAAWDGSALILPSSAHFDPEDVWRQIVHEEISCLSLVATTLQRLLSITPPAAHSLRRVLLGGGPTPAALIAQARDAGIPALRTYGLTEATSQVCTELPADAEGASPPDATSSCGAALDGVEVPIRAEPGRLAAAGEPGEIEVRGPTVFAGYLEDPAATAAALQDGWLRTGDLGELDAAGRLVVHARRSDLILSGGENVYPAELEAVLAAHPAVLEVAVVAAEDPVWGQAPVAFIVKQDAAGRVDAEMLERWCRDRLAAFKVPRRYVMVPARGALGKVDRAALCALLEAGAATPSP